MSQRTDEFVAACRAAIREVKDPVELQRRLTEMVEEAFPVATPVFTPGETLPMHAFLSRYQREICAGVVPSFYDRPVTIVDAGKETILVAIRAAKSENGRNEASPRAMERLERLEQPAAGAGEAAGR